MLQNTENEKIPFRRNVTWHKKTGLVYIKYAHPYKWGIYGIHRLTTCMPFNSSGCRFSIVPHLTHRWSCQPPISCSLIALFIIRLPWYCFVTVPVTLPEYPDSLFTLAPFAMWPQRPPFLWWWFPWPTDIDFQCSSDITLHIILIMLPSTSQFTFAPGTHHPVCSSEVPQPSATLFQHGQPYLLVDLCFYAPRGDSRKVVEGIML